MSGRHSAGLLLYRKADDLEVLMGHMGGPFWQRRDKGAWSIPKGEHGPAEHPLEAARREFVEELGLPVPNGTLLELGSCRQSGGKTVTVWALDGDVDPDAIHPGTFQMEWPRGSGVIRQFPEIDRVGWFSLPAAAEKIVPGQRIFLDRLASRVRG